MKRISFLFIFFSFGLLIAQEDVSIQQVASGFTNPVDIQHAGDSRLFIVEQAGLIKILNDNGTVNTNPFLDITSQVLSGGEQGLLGLAFHPNYQNNRLFYIYYTNTSGDSVISQFETSTTDPNLAIPASQNVLLTFAQPFTNHNGGCIAFGNDGYLYIASGDGGSGGDPNNNGQNLNTLLGKLLRLDIDAPAPYIPASNPYVNDSNALDEVYAYGLRNPWKFSFDEATGDIWIADVGQNQFEEINKSASAKALNYGWRCYEASTPFNTNNCDSQSTMEFPFAAYSHSDGISKCSITGGYVYRGSEFPNLVGKYLFADFCSNEIGTVDNNGNITYFGPFNGNNFSTFGTDYHSNLYIAGLNGTLYKIVDDNLKLASVSFAEIKVFPNPAEDQINIRSDKIIRKIELLSYTGKLMKTYLPNTQDFTITADLPAGLYIIKITSENENQHINKLIIQ